MKKILTIIVLSVIATLKNMDRRSVLIGLVVFTTAAFGQNANPRLGQLEDYLRQHSHGIEFTQKSDGDGDVWYSWRAELDAIGKDENKPSITPGMNKEAMLQTIHIQDSINALVRRRYEDAIDSIRTAFSSVRKDAAESYMYEYHAGSADTISYSVVFRNDAYEDAKFRTEKRRPEEGDNDSNDWWFRPDLDADSLDFYFNGLYQGPYGHYSHYRNEPNGLTEEDRKPFDIAAFETHIQPALEPLLKLQGVKSYPVYWQHDKGYQDDVGSRGNLLYGISVYNIWPAGLTTGTYYFIPAQHQAGPIFDRLDSLAYDYVNRHPEQPYAYHHIPIILRINNRDGSYSPGVFHHAQGDIVESDNDDSDDTNSTKYNLRCFQDDDGLHILSITTKGLLWIPKNFQKMTRWVNGKATYRKN